MITSLSNENYVRTNRQYIIGNIWKMVKSFQLLYLVVLNLNNISLNLIFIKWRKYILLSQIQSSALEFEIGDDRAYTESNQKFIDYMNEALYIFSLIYMSFKRLK